VCVQQQHSGHYSTSVWDTLNSILSKSNEDGLDLGYSEQYTVTMPAYLAPNSPLRNFKFKTNSSHTTMLGMDCMVSKELLCALINKQKCTFATYANTDEISPKNRPSLRAHVQKKLSTC
jgi:hypothetical protein